MATRSLIVALAACAAGALAATPLADKDFDYNNLVRCTLMRPRQQCANTLFFSPTRRTLTPVTVVLSSVTTSVTPLPRTSSRCARLLLSTTSAVSNLIKLRIYLYLTSRAQTSASGVLLSLTASLVASKESPSPGAPSPVAVLVSSPLVL